MSRNLRVYLLLLLFAITVLSPLFFFRLGQSSLVSWDEAWYGAIAKNILKSGDFINLYFNDSRFADHPPAGFWLIALSLKIFGISEFGVRAASAILGLLTLALIFLLGLLISSPAVGLASVLALASSPWFVSRARSGNLDIPLTFFFVLTFTLAILASKNRLFLPLLGLSLGLLLLTKTMIPFTILPSLIIIFLGSRVLLSKEFFISLMLTLGLILSWFIAQLYNFPHFVDRYLAIGLPQGQTKTPLWQNIIQTKTYLHYGIGDWFRPAVLSLPVSLIFLKNKKILALLVFIGMFLIPFAFSSRGQIWHLIPVFPFLIVIALSAFYSLIAKKSRRLAASLTITLTLLISLPQISKNWREFIDIPAFVSDEAILSRQASKYPYPLTIDDRFLPAAVFYSGKYVNYPETDSLIPLFSLEKPQLLITHQWRLDQIPNFKSRYQILKTDRDMVLILIEAPSDKKIQTSQ
jgi:4-amino-4-deoxy-L-arabinose transferase-like glycosyltransferase